MIWVQLEERKIGSQDPGRGISKRCTGVLGSTRGEVEKALDAWGRSEESVK